MTLALVALPLAVTTLPASAAAPPTLSVFAGYVDNLHLGPSGTYGGPFQPIPWQGSSNTIFVGCNKNVSGHPCTDTSVLTHKPCPTIPGSAPACYDAGALRFDNPSDTAVVLTKVTVVIGGCTFDPWAGEPAGTLTVPAHGHLILTQTGGLGPNVACGFAPNPELPYNLDTSDTMPHGKCAKSGYIPSLSVTSSLLGKVVYHDTGQVLNHGGLDPSCTSKKANERSDWSTLVPTYTLDNAMPYGGEPSILSDNTGELYVTSPSLGVQVYKSTNHGVNWAAFPVNPDSSSGDNCLATDQSNAVYACNLAGSVDKCQLQADVWKTLNQGATWQYGSNTTIPMPAGTSCGTSASPFGVDRDWVDAWIPTGKTSTSNAEVILMYHDFYGPSSIWFNKSVNGGATFGAPENVTQHLTTANPTMNAIVAADDACNTVPSGVRIEKSGPHVGRIYLAWIAADAAQDTNGCNVSMAQSFHNLIVAWSDDNGATWTPQVAMDIGVGQDASTPFAAFTIDDQGNPYFAFDSQTPSPGTAPSPRATKCAAESSGSTPNKDPACSYNMYVIWSPNGGTTWDDGKGTPAGSASIPYKASPASQTGTDQFATITAGNPGMVDISYVHTDKIEPQNVYGKFDPLGCDGGDNATGTTPPNYPARCVWNLFVGQSLDLASTTGAPSTAIWTNSQATTEPMHYGDICNLGIACVQQSPANPRDPRHLLDFNLETVDPTTGCAHIAFADDNLGSTYGDPSDLDTAHGNKIVAANQTSGPNIMGLTTGPCASP